MFGAFLKKVPRHLVTVFRGKNILYHFSAAALTYVFVVSGLDWSFYETTRSPAFHVLITVSGIGGFFIPVLVPIGMFVAGELRKKASLIEAGVVSIQSAIVAWIVSSFYKALTGRIGPEFLAPVAGLDTSHDFNFGFWENGIFWGWPSSHTAVACAFAASLIILFGHNKMVRYGAVLYAVFIGVGAAIGFHWLSDVLAGAVIGTLVGILVTRESRRSVR